MKLLEIRINELLSKGYTEHQIIYAARKLSAREALNKIKEMK